MASPSDRSFAIIGETVAGVLPGSGNLLPVDYIPGTRPRFTADQLASQTLSQSRASRGSRRVNYRTEGGMRLHFCRDAAVELLLESALSGAWATNVLKAGRTDRSIAIEERLVEGAGSLYQRFLGCQVGNFTLECSYDGNAEASFDVLGMSRQTATTASSLTYATVGSGLKLTGADVSAVSIAGLSGSTTPDFVNLSLAVRHNREAQGGFGSTSARAIGTAGFRDVQLTLRFYREDFSPETVIGETPLAVSFTIGSGTNGYTVLLPAAYGSVPDDQDEESKALVEVTFAAAFDAISETDLQITRLT